MQGLAWETARSCRRELHHRGTRAVWPDSQFTYKKRPIRPKETTRRVRHTATPSPSVPRALAATALARPLPLATPSRSHNWQHPRPRVCAFDGRAFNSLEFTTRPVRASVSSVPSWKTIAHLVIHFNNPNTPAPRPPIKPQLAACKTLAQQVQGCCSPEHYIARTRTLRHAWPPTTSVKSEALRASQA